MAIKRYIASEDTTITNAYKPDNLTRATGSNMGLADSLEVFYLFGAVSSASTEKSRALVDFPVGKIEEDRKSGNLPESGNVNFFLKLSNVKHNETLPRSYSLSVRPVSRSWDEGHGIDLDSYTDPGYGSGGQGANWIYANSQSSGFVSWSSPGGDFLNQPSYEYSIDKDGTEDLKLDISDLVEDWISNNVNRNGIAVKVSGNLENGSSSYYTKKFSARTSEYFFQRPRIEARWDSSREDDRNNFFVSSSRAPAGDNLNTLYFYNRVRGRYRNIPSIGTGSVYVKLWDTTERNNELSGASPNYPITGGHTGQTGVYSASFALQPPSSSFHDVWYSGSEEYFEGKVQTIESEDQVGSFEEGPRYILEIPNMKKEYKPSEDARFRVYSRKKDWCPSLYNKAQNNTQVNVIENLYYSLSRVADDEVVVPYGTGSSDHTKVSYDVSGSYFDFDISMLEPDYSYRIHFSEYVNGQLEELNDSFKFRVKEENKQ